MSDIETKDEQKPADNVDPLVRPYPYKIMKDVKYLSWVGGWTEDITKANGYMIKWMAEQVAKKIDGAEVVEC